MGEFDDYYLDRMREREKRFGHTPKRSTVTGRFVDYNELERRVLAQLVADQQKQAEFNMAAQSAFANQPKEKKNMSLFKYKNAEGVEVYGKRLVIDGLMWVMKEAGTGTIFPVSPKEVVEVLPYTVGVKLFNNSTIYHYFAKEGEVAEGDLVYVAETSDIAEVVKVDSKSKTATKSLAGWVLSGKKLTVVEVERD